MRNLPVLIVAFNRPDKLAHVISALRKVRPAKVFLAVDGPRADRPGEEDQVKQVQDCIKLLDWGCEITTCFQTENIGCRASVSGAVSWFFRMVPEGIILEDDCVPEPEFFDFCERMLNKFRADPKVMMIGGISYLEPEVRDEQEFSYFYSRIACVHGWASWSRAWQKFDLEMHGLKDFFRSKRLESIFPASRAVDLFSQKFTDAYYGGDSWAYPWAFTLMKEDSFCLRPAFNLVSNIGADQSGTHLGVASTCEMAEKSPVDRSLPEPPLHAYDPRSDASIARRMIAVQWEKKPIRYYLFLTVKRILGRENYSRLKARLKACGARGASAPDAS